MILRHVLLLSSLTEGSGSVSSSFVVRPAKLHFVFGKGEGVLLFRGKTVRSICWMLSSSVCSVAYAVNFSSNDEIRSQIHVLDLRLFCFSNILSFM